MSDIESATVRLEDGEIDEGCSEPSSICTPSAGDCINNTFLQCSEEATNAEIKINNSEKTSDKMAIPLGKPKSPEPKKRSHLVPSSSKATYSNQYVSRLLDDDEMLCVRGASPVSFTMTGSHFVNHSPQYETDTHSIEIISPKKRKTSKKLRRKKRSHSKKVAKNRSASSSDDQHISKTREDTQSSQQPKLQQLCKFYIQECCAKGKSCEYMHSEFPCKFFYMGLQCEDEGTRGHCKLSHGGTLSCEMLIALIRHIHTAPTDVLGKKFVELRSQMQAGEASKMLHDMQEKLQSPTKETQSTATKPDTDFIATLREKLYFLSEEQIDKLKTLRISKAEDLLCLTLAQLNAIGIHAIQIEAIQMSLIAGQDMDMRNIFPPPATETVTPVQVVELPKDVDCREITVCKELESNDLNWYDDERPLVIDESEKEDNDAGGIKSDGSTDDKIDVVGISPCSDCLLPSPNDDEKIHSESSLVISNYNQALGKSSSGFQDSKETTINANNSIEVEANEIVSLTTIPTDPEMITVPRQSIHEENAELQMEVDILSDDWDAEEEHSASLHTKEVETIDSPDNSDDEATPSLSNGFCPELPLRTPNLDNYKPAMEIDAHLTYPAMEYKLHEIYLPDCEVNKPSLLYKLLKSNSTDPRLKKFLEKEKNYGIFPQTDYSFFPPTMSQCDPRVRPSYGNSGPTPHCNPSSILYGYLQGSRWYQELKSNFKIQINHSVANLVRALNVFHKDPSPMKIFDLFQIECAGVLLEVMRNVGIFIDVNGNITEEKNYKQLCAPQQVCQSYNTNRNNIASSATTGGSFGDGCGASIRCAVGVPTIKPGLLGFAPPGVGYEPPHMRPSSDECSFMRQAFGNDYPRKSYNEFHATGNSFYVANRNFNRKPGGVDFEPTVFRGPTKWNLKRRL